MIATYEAGSNCYRITLTNDVVVTLKSVGLIWETWCCELGFTHANERDALDWAFELSLGFDQ